MLVEAWLTVGAKKVAGGLAPANVKLYMKKPASTAGVTVKLMLNLPDELFVKPVIEATLNVPGGSPGGWKITAEAKNKLQEVLVEQLGMYVEIGVKQ